MRNLLNSKERKNAAKVICVFLFGFALMYFLFSFVMLSFYPSAWGLDVRATYVVFSVVISFGIGLFIS